MNTDLMRFIDYWIGVPLCFLLRIQSFLANIIFFRNKISTKPSVLFIKLSEMGGIILSYSLIRKIRNDYPECKTFFLTFKKNKPIVEALGVIPIRNILTIRDDSFLSLAIDTFKVLFRMKKEKIDIVFDLELFSRFTAILSCLSGAKRRVGNYRYYFEGLYRGNLQTHNIQYNPLLHTSKSFLSMAQEINLEKKISPEMKITIKDEEIEVPKFNPKSEDVDRMWLKLSEAGLGRNHRLILINPGDGIIPLREWTVDSFATLTKMLLEEELNRIIIIGTIGASKKACRICQLVNDKRCIDFTGKTTVEEILSLFSISSALIANDCGLAHIATLAPLKKFIIFGPESPQIYSPLGENVFVFYSHLACSPCLSALNHRRSSCKDNHCLKVISPQEVYKIVKERI